MDGLSTTTVSSGDKFGKTIIKRGMSKGDIYGRLGEMVDADYYSGLLPDWQSLEDEMSEQVEYILSQLPYGMEAFNAEAAGRGMYTGGESMKYLSQTVTAPITRAATSTMAEAKLRLAELMQQGNLAAAGLSMEAVLGYLNALLREEELDIQRDLANAQKWGGIGSIFGSGVGLGAMALSQGGSGAAAPIAVA